MSNTFFSSDDDGQFSQLEKLRLSLELEKQDCFDGESFVRPFVIANLSIKPLSFGGFIELQILNHPVLNGWVPESTSEDMQRSLELFAVLSGRTYAAHNISSVLTPHEFMFCVELGLAIIKNALSCSRSLAIALSAEKPAMPFGWWGSAVVTLVRDCNMRTVEAMSTPMLPSVVEFIMCALQKRNN